MVRISVTLHAARCTLHVARCTVHAARCLGLIHPLLTRADMILMKHHCFERMGMDVFGAQAVIRAQKDQTDACPGLDPFNPLQQRDQHLSLHPLHPAGFPVADSKEVSQRKMIRVRHPQQSRQRRQRFLLANAHQQRPNSARTAPRPRSLHAACRC